ncbi:MAG: class I SAM-dependent methyltransferase [Anaerolineae bacterium]|nr:class I SAM-dependent methyltransferase [Anaerolineae bacterium]
MDLNQVCLDLAILENDQSLFGETNLNARAEALDRLGDFRTVLHFQEPGRARKTLEQKIATLQCRLEQIDCRLFHHLRTRLQAGDYTPDGLRRELGRYTDDVESRTGRAHYDYDGLDVLVSGVFLTEPEPQEIKERQPGMVHLEAVPASVILELVDRVALTGEDVFYDLGSGLGQVAILVHLLTGVKAKGIEYEPAFCAYARQCAQDFGLSAVEFFNIDARDADYAEGTVFFMFTPFMGSILQDVLSRLYLASRERPIWVCTFGPCTIEAAKQHWLKSMDKNADHEFKLALFKG